MLTRTDDLWQEWTDEDAVAAARQIRSGDVSIVQGGVMGRFEKRFAAFAGARFGVSTCNGTGALHAALWAVGVGPGDEVAVCDYGFHGMAAAALTLGACIVPVDGLPGNLCMDPQDLARALSPRVRAVLVHNPWGVPADLARLAEVCGELPIVVDASHAHGAIYRSRALGAHAAITCYSLGRGKLVSGGELGCAVTDDAGLRDRMLMYGHVNRVPGDLSTPLWDGQALGIKLRPHPVALNLALRQLDRFESKRAAMEETALRMERRLAPLGFRPMAVPADSRRVWWRVVMLAEDTARGHADVARVTQALQSNGIAVEPNHYWPSLQNGSHFRWPAYASLIRRRECPTVATLAPLTLTIQPPIMPTLTWWQAFDDGVQAAAGSKVCPFT
jgi:perosamine synthetase